MERPCGQLTECGHGEADQRSSRPHGRSQAFPKGGLCPPCNPPGYLSRNDEWGKLTNDDPHLRNNRTQKPKTVFKGVEGQRLATEIRMPLEAHRKAVERLKRGGGY